VIPHSSTTGLSSSPTHENIGIINKEDQLKCQNKITQYFAKISGGETPPILAHL
jgi:hypothetical protein